MPQLSSTSTWAARIPLAQAQELASLRNTLGLVACQSPPDLWLAGTSVVSVLSDELAQHLRLAIGAELFQVTETRSVIPRGKRVPTGLLPAGPWLALTELFEPQVPLARCAASRPGRCPLTIVRSDAIVSPTWLRLPLAAWSEYVSHAPQLRLARWEFAANAAGEVLVRGMPLPPLPGQQHWEADGLIVPCGWTWSPAVTADIVRQILSLPPGTFALADCATSTWEPIPADAFVPARRQNVRRTVIERVPLTELSP